MKRFFAREVVIGVAMGSAFIAAISSFAIGAQTSVTAQFSHTEARRGDTIVVQFSDPRAAVTSATFSGGPALHFLYQGESRVVLGIPATAPAGTHRVNITLGDGTVIRKAIRVRLVPGKPYKVRLGIPEKLGLTSGGLLKELQTKKENWSELLNTRTAGVFFREPFASPIAGSSTISGIFGEIRKTGGAEIRHLGTDFAAPTGTPVRAVNDGIVRRAYEDSLYGNSVIVDHGEGIYSLYLHLAEIKVREVQRVVKGETVGTLGESGYALAPHLHLSIKLGGVSVDPLRFLAAFE